MKNILFFVFISLAFFIALTGKEVQETVLFEDFEVDEQPEQPPLQEVEAPPVRSTSSNERSRASSPKEQATCQEMLAASPFYRADSSQVAIKESQLRQEGNIEIADLLQAISCVPQGIWVSGKDPDWEAARARQIVAQAQQQGKIPIFVIYDGPEHEEATWRHVETGEAYEEWIRTLANALGTVPVWIVFEPDALPLAFNFSQEDRSARLQELKSGVKILKEQNPNARVYLDAGHHQWKGAEIVAGYLKEAGIALADGFSLNVSNHQEVLEEIAYGVEIAKLVGGTHFIIDTGQAGKRVEGQGWCNAMGRALGKTSTQDTGNVLIDAFVWAKPPGESDGTCNGGPSPGKFWLEYALQLIANR